MTAPTLQIDGRPLKRIRPHALWVIVAFFLALSYFAASGLVEKLDERADARTIRSWTETGVLFSQLIHELQKERGLSSGLIAAAGAEFGPALAEQHGLTDRVVVRLRQSLAAQPEQLTAPVRRVLAELEDIARLRRSVLARQVVRDEVVAWYTRLITPLFEQLVSRTGSGRSGRLIRQQLAFLFFLQAKEMAGQERALITAMLSAGDYSAARAAAFHRIKAEEAAHHEKFLQLADDAVRALYASAVSAPFMAEADAMRQRVVAAYSGEQLPGRMVAQAARWFELASLKIDALNRFEQVLSERLLRSAGELQDQAQAKLLLNAAGVVTALALAALALAQLWQGRARAEQDLELAAEVFAHSVESIIIADAAARIVEVNRAFTRITGYSRAEVIGRKTSVLNSGRHDAAFYAAMWDKLLATGAWEGEVWNRRKSGELYPALLSIVAVRRGGRRDTTHYIAMTVDLSKYKETEAMLEQLRTFDALTGLPNREAWRSAVDQAVAGARRSGGRFALLDLGLDRFKLINESLGHAAGDDVLVGAAERIRQLLRRHDVAARTGGDRFAILLPDMDEAHAIGALCERLLAEFRRPLEVHGEALHVSVSIGVALFPDDGEDARALLRNAETALHRAKDHGRNGYKFYSSEMNAAGSRMLALEQLLRRALDRHEFSLAWQPQIDARDGRISGAEVLLRWRTAELGQVSPVQFIPIAEATGIIVAIGDWVLHEACRQAAQWRRASGRELQVAVNLSACQFRSADLPATVRGALEASGLPPELLELEITESALISDPPAAIRIMGELRALGVKIALDDFGTGYSSLAYLKSLPLDRLKLDRGFVRDLPDSASDCAISRTVIALGHNLGLQVLAEGIETAAQRDFLAEAGCDCFQGFLFARPLPAAEFAALLAGTERRIPARVAAAQPC